MGNFGIDVCGCGYGYGYGYGYAETRREGAENRRENRGENRGGDRREKIIFVVQKINSIFATFLLIQKY